VHQPARESPSWQTMSKPMEQSSGRAGSQAPQVPPEQVESGWRSRRWSGRPGRSVPVLQRRPAQSEVVVAGAAGAVEVAHGLRGVGALGLGQALEAHVLRGGVAGALRGRRAVAGLDALTSGPRRDRSRRSRRPGRPCSRRRRRRGSAPVADGLGAAAVERGGALDGVAGVVTATTTPGSPSVAVVAAGPAALAPAVGLAGRVAAGGLRKTRPPAPPPPEPQSLLLLPPLPPLARRALVLATLRPPGTTLPPAPPPPPPPSLALVAATRGRSAPGAVWDPARMKTTPPPAPPR
jgi:hypothetical protein